MKKRPIIITIISIISIIFISSFFIRWIPPKTRIIDPLMIDVSKVTLESAAPDLLNTNQDYYFRILNISDKSVKLIGIELSNYMGMNVGELTYKGKTINGVDVPSNTDQGLEIHYTVTIKQAKIINPKIATITYSSMGVIHKQVIEIVGTPG